MTTFARWISMGGLLALLGMNGCSGAPQAAAVVVPHPSIAAEQAAALPSVVTDFATIIPIDAGFVVELPDAAKAAEMLPPEQRGAVTLLRPLLESSMAGELGVDKDTVADLIDGFERATIFGDAKNVAAIARFRERAPVEKLLASMERIASESTPSREVFRRKKTERERIVYYPAPRLLVVTTSVELPARIEGVAAGRATPFSKHPRRLPDDASAMRLYADFDVLSAGDASVRGYLDRGSGVRATLALENGSLHSRVELSLVGEHVPRLATLFDSTASTLAPKLPEETVMFSSISVKRKGEKTLRDVIKEIERATGESGSGERLDALAKKEIGAGLDDIGAILGGEVTFGAAATPNARLTVGDDPLRGLDQAMFFALVSTRDDASAKKLLSVIATKVAKLAAKSKEYRVVASGPQLRFTPLKAGEPSIRVEPHAGAVTIELGAPALMDRLTHALDRNDHPLGATAGYQRTAAFLQKPSNGLLWIDLDRAARVLGKGSPSLSGRIGTATALLAPSDRGIDMTVEGQNGAETFVIGTGAAFAIYGVRRYLANAKVAEAKNTVSAIARGAVAAYERELPGPQNSVVHRLCKSASPVPQKVPSGVKYAPSSAQGADFETGNDAAGWRCLRFAMTMPHYYQYEYRQGGPYKGPARGGPDPGPDGFEVSAEGDLDGNGKTSLFTYTGKLDRARGMVVMSQSIFVADEFE